VPGQNSKAQIASASHFQFKACTQWSYPVVLDTVDLARIDLTNGDEIGVFDGDLCVGAGVYTGHFPLVITTWADDISTPEVVDGYRKGQLLTFVWHNASKNVEAKFLPELQDQTMPDDQIAPQHAGFGKGLYAKRRLMQGVASLTQLPENFHLGQNFPNPFNSETIIPLELPQRSHVRVELFNLRGQNLGVIFEGTENAGWPKISYNASALSSGIYFYRVTAEGLERSGKFQSTSKMLLLK
jgi:hypothetical protein